MRSMPPSSKPSWGGVHGRRWKPGLKRPSAGTSTIPTGGRPCGNAFMAASASVSLQREARMRVFVIGTEGQVARSLREVAASFDDLELACGCRPGLDLLNPASLHAALADFRPDVVINPAAYTAVDRAESEPDLAFAINRDGARAAAV